MEHLGFLTWKDPYAWTETDHAAQAHAIREENRLFKHTVSAAASKSRLHKTREAFLRAFHAPKIRLPIGPDILVEVQLDVDGVYYWKHKRDAKWKYADDLDYANNYVAYTQDVIRGQLDYTLHVKTPTSHWTHKKKGGSGVAIVGQRVYFIEGDQPLKYMRLVSLSLATGSQRRVLYEETNPSISLTLVKAENRGLFLLGEDAGYQRLWLVAGDGLKRLEPGGVSFRAVGVTATGDPIYFVRPGDFTKPWRLVGADWKLNRAIETAGIEFCSYSLQVLITKFQGIRTIWHMSASAPPKQLDSGFFTVLPYTGWPFWRGESGGQVPIWIRSPTTPVYKILVAKGEIYLDKPPSYTDGITGESTATDGMRVRWLLLQNDVQKKPKGLMVTAYGAYGLDTNLNTTRWRPWLSAGWAVAHVFVRGGGDSNEAWAELGRLGGKLGALDDFTAALKDLQKKTGLAAGRTCIFGRSAGGLIIGNMVAKYPRGDLFRCVYAEAPYVDLLKTASNPKLPLTAYEYKEFAQPRAGPAEFEQALRMSPIHALPADGAPSVAVLCRSGAGDLQVFPYESLKWILTLRGVRADTSKILHVNSQAHHTYGGEMYLEYSEDFHIINHWLN